ncbi:MAG: YkgJ family cysteine cluster protein [Bdellovibrionaceae bacterium]|nr:YkgJ family cysteine cluster protein [Pseudobdellovibrionaceae bacterium]
MKIDENLVNDGLRFQCQGSGKCCTSHGEYGFVFLTLEDRRRFAKYLDISTRKFTSQYCEQRSGVWHLKEDPKNPDCMFLKNKKCSVYEARPIQCRTWPFWPEVLNAKAWKKDVVSFCPGIGKGKLYSAAEIKSIAQQQHESEDELIKHL